MASARPELLIACKGFWPHVGGVEEAARRLAVPLADDFRVTVLAVSDDRSGCDTCCKHIRVVKLPLLMRPLSTPIAAGFAQAFRRLAASSDIIHVHSPWPMGELALLTARLRSPVVLTWHFDIVKQRAVAPLYRPLVAAVLKRCARVICSNPNLAATSPYLANCGEKLAVIPFGIETSAWEPRGDEASEVERIRLRNKHPLVLFVGRLVYYKGVDVLLRAIAQIDANLALIGTGPLEDELKRLARSLRIEGRVAFLGALPNRDLRLYYNACDVFVLPSVARSEAFGLVLLEAMCAGKPLITTELGTGTSWINQHGQTGLVVPPRDPGALAQAISMIAADRTLADEY
ncbi:MAG: glycosyltransferase, partial [Cryobacterium sp.]